MESFIPGFNYIDEVIVYSDFIKNTMERFTNNHCKITKLKYPFNDN